MTDIDLDTFKKTKDQNVIASMAKHNDDRYRRVVAKHTKDQELLWSMHTDPD